MRYILPAGCRRITCDARKAGELGSVHLIRHQTAEEMVRITGRPAFPAASSGPGAETSLSAVSEAILHAPGVDFE